MTSGRLKLVRSSAGPSDDRQAQPASPCRATSLDGRKIKVLVLVSELEDYTIAFVNGLSRHLRVVLAVPRRQYSHLSDWIAPSVDLRLLDWPRHSSLRNMRFLLTLTRLIRREKPSVIHLLSNNTIWLNLAAPFWQPIPLMTTVHDISAHPGDKDTRRLPEWATQLIVRQSTDIVVHGEQLKRLAIERFGKSPSAVHVLSHPAIVRYADLAGREKLTSGRRPGTFNLLLFGRIYAYKGLNHLLCAEGLLGRRIPNLRVTIAGRGDDPWMSRALMGDPTRYDIRHRFIGDREVAELFLDADLVVLPYSEASQSGVLHLASSFGKPVVVTDVGELGTTVDTHGLGRVVPPDNPAALADAICHMANQSRLRTACGENALAWARGESAPETVGARAAELYLRVADTGAKR